MKSAHSSSTQPDMKLFWACFIALVATSFVFGVRANTMLQLQSDFNLSEQEKGNIGGAGMWPFAISIIFFSLIIDRIGYKLVALFAIACHTISLILTVKATGYSSFYWATLLIAIANGSVEAFVNPVVATMFPKSKAKWLNILHAGWPAGLALGALATAVFTDHSWQFKYSLCFIPLVIYAILTVPRMFPINERVAAGISYRDMLREVGGIGFFILGSLLYFAIMQMAGEEASAVSSATVGAIVGIAALAYTRSLGNWLFLVVLITIGPLATTELGTDGWMPDLLKLNGPDVRNFEMWIFVYVSTIMTVLRFYAGPIVHRFSPIGLLVIGTMIAITGLLLLSHSVGWAILGASTVYALGKTFLWSTTLGLTSEQFPKGGALTLNGVSAVGVLFLGVLGSPYIGYKQDMDMEQRLNVSEHAALYEKVKGEEKDGMFGKVPSLDQAKIQALPEVEQQQLTAVQAEAKRGAFTTIAILPTFMLICYLGLFVYFRMKGGYKPIEIGAH